MLLPLRQRVQRVLYGHFLYCRWDYILKLRVFDFNDHIQAGDGIRVQHDGQNILPILRLRFAQIGAQGFAKIRCGRFRAKVARGEQKRTLVAQAQADVAGQTIPGHTTQRQGSLVIVGCGDLEASGGHTPHIHHAVGDGEILAACVWHGEAAIVVERDP